MAEEIADAQQTNASKPLTGIQTFISIVVSPTEAFESLRIKATIVFPLLVVLLLQAAVMVLYFQLVDFNWFVDASLANLPTDVAPEVKESQRSALDMMGRYGLMAVSTIPAIIIIPLMLALWSGYFAIVSAISSDGVKFGRWFSYMCWCTVPTVFALIATAVNVVLSGGQILLENANPLSLNSLLFSLNPGDEHYRTATSIGLTNIWGLILMILGYKVFTNKDWIVSALVVLAPLVLIVGGVVLIFG